MIFFSWCCSQAFCFALLHRETIASYRNAGQQDVNSCAIRHCRMSKILQRRKSRVCFLSCLLLLRKQVVLLQAERHLLFHMCVCSGASSSLLRNIKFFVLSLYVEQFDLGYGYLLEEDKRLCRQNGTIGVTILLWATTYCLLLLLCNLPEAAAAATTKRRCVSTHTPAAATSMLVATSAYSLLATAPVVILARLLLNSNPALDDILARLHDILRATERKKEHNYNKSETGTRGGETLDRSLARKTSVCCKIQDKGRHVTTTTTKERKPQQILRKKKKIWSIFFAFHNCGLIF